MHTKIRKTIVNTIAFTLIQDSPKHISLLVPTFMYKTGNKSVHFSKEQNSTS